MKTPTFQAFRLYRTNAIIVIEVFIKSNNLTISLPPIPTGFCTSDFKKTFALDGPYNTVITNLLITICKEDSHAEEK